MNTNIAHARILAGATLLTLAPMASAQYAITWFAAPCGGDTNPIAGGPYTLETSIGDPLATSGGTGGSFGLGGGFLQGAGAGGSTCYANCDGSTTSPALTVNDFICFQSRFAANDPYANCDGSTTSPTLTVNDFICFQSQFAAGCP